MTTIVIDDDAVNSAIFSVIRHLYPDTEVDLHMHREAKRKFETALEYLLSSPTPRTENPNNIAGLPFLSDEVVYCMTELIDVIPFNLIPRNYEVSGVTVLNSFSLKLDVEPYVDTERYSTRPESGTGPVRDDWRENLISRLNSWLTEFRADSGGAER